MLVRVKGCVGEIAGFFGINWELIGSFVKKGKKYSSLDKLKLITDKTNMLHINILVYQSIRDSQMSSD